jgi:phosphohistidine phosphatase
MRRLILLRHAKAEPRAAGGDIERPLSQRGRSDAAIMGRLLAREGDAPDLALVSVARRTRETWDLAAPAFPKARALVLDGLYNAGSDEMLCEIEDHADDAESLMLVGHNPGLHELAVGLLIAGAAAPWQIERMSARFPTATAAVFAIDAAGRASLDGLFLAKDHGGDGD